MLFQVQNMISPEGYESAMMEAPGSLVDTNSINSDNKLGVLFSIALIIISIIGFLSKSKYSSKRKF